MSAFRWPRAREVPREAQCRGRGRYAAAKGKRSSLELLPTAPIEITCRTAGLDKFEHSTLRISKSSEQNLLIGTRLAYHPGSSDVTDEPRGEPGRDIYVEQLSRLHNTISGLDVHQHPPFARPGSRIIGIPPASAITSMMVTARPRSVIPGSAVPTAPSIARWIVPAAAARASISWGSLVSWIAAMSASSGRNRPLEVHA